MSKVRPRGGQSQPRKGSLPSEGAQTVLKTEEGIWVLTPHVTDEETEARPEAALGINSRAENVPELGPRPSTLSFRKRGSHPASS